MTIQPIGLVPYLLLLSLLVYLCSSASYAPVWVPSPYMQADSKKIITTKTGNTSTPTGTMPFSVPFSAIPNLGYGITSYQGDDFLYQQMFQVNRTALTTSSFSFLVKIQGITNIWLMQVRYVGIDKLFPHHLNSFDNVPVNYTYGPLVSISTANATTQTFRNAINYTKQSIDNLLTYTTFSTPLTNNKVLLFMTSLYVKSTVQSGGTVYPINLIVVANVLNTSHYQFFVTYSKSSAINRLHFSMIVFDQVDILSSMKYQLVYTKIDLPTSGGFYAFPIEFVKNFMIGFTDFASPRSGSTIHYNMLFNATVPTGTYMPVSVPRSSKVPLSRFGFTIFYLKTWQCIPDTFFNVTSNMCEGCPILNCRTCQNLYVCKECDATLNYYLDTATGLCYTCTIPGCTSCSAGICTVCDAQLNYVLSAGACVQCGANTFANPSTHACDPCPLTNCTTCLTLTKCQVCDSTKPATLNPTTHLCQYCDPTLNYFLDGTLLNCVPCPLSNCSVCADLSTCTACINPNINLLDISTGQCQPCPITHCTLCMDDKTCFTCDTVIGYFLDNTVTPNICITCSILGCILCDSPTTCLTCNTTDNYYKMNPTDTTCTNCDASLRMFVNTTSNTCQICMLTNCTTCQTLYKCLVCDSTLDSYLDSSGLCAYCDPNLNYFLNTSLQCQQCTIPYCTICLNLTACHTCDSSLKFYQDLTDTLCYPCTIDYCVECDTLYRCKVCDQMALYLLNNSTGECQQCNIIGCLNCSSLTTCEECDAVNGYGFDFTNPSYDTCGTCNQSCTCDGYVKPWNPVLLSCSTLCGDGYTRLYQQCDDGNAVSGDGCSSTCQVQRFYRCDTHEPNNLCTLHLYIPAQLITILRQGCNGFVITVNTQGLQAQWIAKYISITNPHIFITSIQQSAQYIAIHAQYTHDIANQIIQLKFNPGDTLNITYSPTLPAILYDQNQCQTIQQVQNLLQGVQVISYIILIISIISCKIVGLQLFGVLQLAYFTLSSHSYLNIYLSPLNKFKTFNGLNVDITKQSSSQIPFNYKQMGLSATFINNCNIMLFVLFTQLIVAATMYIVSKILHKYQLQKLALRFLKQGFITLVLFNIFNISFSAGVHWKYANPHDNNYGISSCILYGTLIAMIVSVIAMQLTSSQQYGQFKNKYKKVWICQLYIPLTIIYRMILGFYQATKSDYAQSTLIILGFSLVFMLYVLVNLPFVNVYQNYRCGLVHATMLYILIVTNYYRSMKSNTPIQVKGRIYGPAVGELVAIVACIIVSFVVLVYEVYQIVRVWRRNKRIGKNKDQMVQMGKVEEDHSMVAVAGGIQAPPHHVTQDSLTYINN